jgi:anthranilate phosphoribosyltransferase
MLEQAASLFGQVLDGWVGDLEVGAFCPALRINGETPQATAGLSDAADARLARVAVNAPMAGVFPNCNGVRKLPVLTPLAALLLAREAQAVVVHGAACGFAPCASRP